MTEQNEAPVLHPATDSPVTPEPEPSEPPVSSSEGSPDENAVDFASQFAALSRREREMHMQQRDLAAKEAQLQEQMAKVSEYEQNIALAKENPQEFLKHAGVSLGEVINQEVSGEVSESVALRAELERQQQELADLKERETQRTEQAETKRLNGLKKSYVDQISEFVDNKGDEFELVKKAGAYETVYQVLQQNYNETGSDIGFDAAAKIVNDYYAGELKRFSGTRTLKQLYEASTEAPKTPSPAAMEGPTKTVAPQVKTLSNTQAVATTSTEPRVLTQSERLRKFAETIKWQ